MNKIKIVLFQTMIISFFILMVLVIGEIVGFIAGETTDIPWYIPGSIVLISFLASLPSLIFFIRSAANRKVYRVLILLHYLMLFVIVSGGGWLFGWYTTGGGFINLIIAYTVIYGLVWQCMGLMNKHDEKVINEALKDMQDEE